jgi:hypothetical protein
MLDFNAALSIVVKSNKKSQQTENLPAGVKPNGPSSAELLGKMHHYWCAANHLYAGQIYLLDNPLLCEPLRIPPSSAHSSPWKRVRPRGGIATSAKGAA